MSVDNILNLSKKLVSILKEKKLKITFAESCTGGLMSSSLVDIPGSSTVFEFGYVVYSAKSKNEMVGVSFDTINQSGIVSTDVAIEMVKGAVNKSGASVGISVTGCAGPGMDSDGNAAGTLCFGFYLLGKYFSKRIVADNKTRKEVREFAVQYAFDTLCKELEL